MNNLLKSRTLRRALIFFVAVLILNFYLLRPIASWSLGTTGRNGPGGSGVKAWTEPDGPDSKIGMDYKVQAPISQHLRNQQSNFLQSLYKQLNNTKPHCDGPALSQHVFGIGFDGMGEMKRPDYVMNADEIREPLIEAHDAFIAGIKDITNMPYVPGSRGIVSSAGGDYLPTFIASLRMTRRTGCTLPVEVFLNDWSEYEPYICKVILPELNARCIVLSEMLEDAGLTGDDSPHFEHYQIKPFALALSSFETLIWMDSDCIPLHDPATLLEAEPFTSNGLVTWPDIWANTASPLWFNITRQEEPPMNFRQSSEAGIILLSKRKHSPTLLLSIYYNYYGPDFWWDLQGQAAYGEGDKDTFLAAASALGADYYAVSDFAGALDIIKRDRKSTIISAMIQGDPIEDYNLTTSGIWRVQNKSAAVPTRAFFIHAVSPKFNAGLDVVKNAESVEGRIWASPPIQTMRLGYDVEKVYWEEVMQVTCALEHSIISWQHKSGLCEAVHRVWNNIILNPNTTVPLLTFNETLYFEELVPKPEKSDDESENSKDSDGEDEDEDKNEDES